MFPKLTCRPALPAASVFSRFAASQSVSATWCQFGDTHPFDSLLENLARAGRLACHFEGSTSCGVFRVKSEPRNKAQIARVMLASIRVDPPWPSGGKSACPSRTEQGGCLLSKTSLYRSRPSRVQLTGAVRASLRRSPKRIRDIRLSAGNRQSSPGRSGVINPHAQGYSPGRRL